MASFASSANTGGARKHAWTKRTPGLRAKAYNYHRQGSLNSAYNTIIALLFGPIMHQKKCQNYILVVVFKMIIITVY